MTIIQTATNRLSEAERQYKLGSELAGNDAAYWAAYLDGARAQKKEDDQMGVNMTNDRAMKILENMTIAMYAKLKGLERSDPLREELALQIEAIDRSVDALRQHKEYLMNLRGDMT